MEKELLGLLDSRTFHLHFLFGLIVYLYVFKNSTPSLFRKNKAKWEVPKTGGKRRESVLPKRETTLVEILQYFLTLFLYNFHTVEFIKLPPG